MLRIPASSLARGVTPCAALLVAVLAAGCVKNTPAPTTGRDVLPLRTVRLYETGVGYFEREGALRGGSGATLPVPASHIDDALKSLIVLDDAGGATVGGLEFSASVSAGMARALAGLPKDATSPITYLDLLSSLEGEEVEVAVDDETILGRIIDVVEAPATPSEGYEDEEEEDEDTAPPPLHELLLLTRSGSIRRFPLDTLNEVRPKSGVAASRLALAVRSVSPRAAQSQRMLSVIANARGSVRLGYVAETALWRTSYRILLDRDRKHGTLEGWVLLHNDTDEAWQGVRVELVNGRPDSFLFPFAAPRYGRRGLVTPEEPLSTVPQLLDQTPDGIWGDHADLEHGAGTGTGMGFGSGAGRLGASHRTRAPRVRMGATMVTGRTESSDLLEIGNLAGVTGATGVEAGALFVYTLPNPLDLRAHGSALVPFVQRPISARSITFVDADEGAARMAIVFRNDTGQTLPPGPASIFAGGGFAGESVIDRLKPGEQRWLGFGADIDVEVTKTRGTTSEEAHEVTFVDGGIKEHFVRTEALSYRIENRGGQPRSVHCALDVVANTRLEGADGVERDPATGTTMAVFEVKSRDRVDRPITVTQGLARTHTIDGIDEDLLDRLAESPALAEDRRALLRAAKGPWQELERVCDEHDKATNAIEELEADLERLRADMEAVSGDSGGAAAPFVKRVLEAEDGLRRLRAEVSTLETEIGRRRDAFALSLAALGRQPRATSDPE